MRQDLTGDLVLKTRSFEKKFWIPMAVAVILAYPSWHYFIKDLIYHPGPVFSTPSDSLRNMLIRSDIKEQLREFQFVVLKPALDVRLDGGRYTGSRNLRFYKTRMYLKLLEDILSRNRDRLYYHIDEKNKIIIISLRDQVESFPYD